MIERYEYGVVESARAISHQADYNGYKYDKKHCLGGVLKEADREFVAACFEFFHPKSPEKGSSAQLERAVTLLPKNGQWRQGASTHQLVIWPAEPDPEKVVIDGYWGKDATRVGDFHHGTYTWFCIMAHALVTTMNTLKEALEDA